MPFAHKRRLANDKKLQSDAKKCQKINSFFVPIARNKDGEENENYGDGGIQEKDDREYIDLPDENDDDKGNDEDMYSFNDDSDKETHSNSEKPDSLIDGKESSLLPITKYIWLKM